MASLSTPLAGRDLKNLEEYPNGKEYLLFKPGCFAFYCDKCIPCDKEKDIRYNLELIKKNNHVQTFRGGVRVWCQERSKCSGEQEWNFTAGAAMPTLLKNKSVSENDWQRFLEEIHRINAEQSRWISFWKTLQIPFLTAFGCCGCLGSMAIEDNSTMHGARATGNDGGGLELFALWFFFYVLFGLPSAFFGIFVSCCRGSYMNKLKHIENNFNAKFENGGLHFHLKSLPVSGTRQNRVFEFLFTDPSDAVFTEKARVLVTPTTAQTPIYPSATANNV